MPGVGQYNCYDEKKMKSNNSPKCTFGYENKKNFVDILNKTFVPGPSVKKNYKINIFLIKWFFINKIKK